jgi:hypothetical protein
VLSAVSVNASNLTPQLLQVCSPRIHAGFLSRFAQDIEAGRYQVVISSPEAYMDASKLRSILLSKDLASKRHITITDEAHTIKLWGQSIHARRLAQLKNWGYTPGSHARSRETEAVNSADKIVPVVSLALRQWRVQVLEPLATEGRLHRSVLLLVRRPDVKDKTPERVQRMLKLCGVRGVDPSRKTLKRHFQPQR